MDLFVYKPNMEYLFITIVVYFQAISEYMIGQEGDPTELKATLKDVKNFIKKPDYDDPAILAVVKSKDDPIYQLFINANNDIREDFDFGHTFSEDVRKHFGLKNSAILIIHPEHIRTKHEPKFHKFDVKMIIISMLFL